MTVSPSAIRTEFGRPTDADPEHHWHHRTGGAKVLEDARQRGPRGAPCAVCRAASGTALPNRTVAAAHNTQILIRAALPQLCQRLELLIGAHVSSGGGHLNC